MYFNFSVSAGNDIKPKIETDGINKAEAIKGYAVYIWGEIFNMKELLDKSTAIASQHITTAEDALLVLYKKYKYDFALFVNGHYAIIIVDYLERKMLLFSDRFNAIPPFFYYSKDTKTLIIADDVRKISRRRNVETETNWEYFFLMHSKDLKSKIHPTFAKNIFLLNGGCCLTLSLLTFETSHYSYWDLEHVYLNHLEANRLDHLSEHEITAGYRGLFVDAVKMRNTNAAETALLLSGGYDSGAIARSLDIDPAVIYTACTFNSLLNNELDRASDLSAELHCDHYIIPFSLKQGISPDDWCETVYTSQNVNTSLDFFIKNQLIVHLKKSYPGIKYILSGYGSDQLLGGTTKYDLTEGRKNESWEDFFEKLIYHEKTEMLSWFHNSLYEFSQNFFNSSFIPGFRLNRHNEYWLSYIEKKKHAQTYIYSQLESQLCSKNNLLARYPFWDNNLVDFTLSIPARYHKDLFFDKNLLRKAMTDVMPHSFNNAPKFKTAMPFKNYIIYQFLRPILYGNNYALIQRIFDESKTFGNVFNKDLLFGFLEYNKRSEYFAAYGFILEIINIGLLDLLLQQKDKDAEKYDWNYTPIVINGEDRNEAFVKINEVMDLHRYRMMYNYPVVKLMQTEVLHSEADKKRYLKVEGSLLPIENDEFAIFMNSINGSSSINAIVENTKLNLEKIEGKIHQLIAMGAIGFKK